MSEQQAVMHRAEEYGQSRALTVDEIKALRSAAIVGGALAGAVMLVLVIGYWLYETSGLLALLALSPFAGFLIGAGAVLVKGMRETLDGLRSYREATSYSPPLPEPQQANGPPVLVRPYKGEPYMLGSPERPQLPGRQEALQITPPIVAEVLKASVEEYQGEWSRRKLMRLRIAGQKVSRGMYEELTAWLSRAGVLLQTRQGGFTLPPDVQTFEDLRQYFPNLPGLGGPGGHWEGGERGTSQDSQPANRGVRTLAQRHQLSRMQDLDHAVKLYLEGKGDHG